MSYLLNHRQSLAVLMASAVVVLKHETSTLRQSHNFISIDLKFFGVGDYVMEVTSTAKFGSGPMSGRDATWGQHIRVLWPSESVMKNRPKRTLVEILRWRHIRLAIKSRYLGNHASRIKSYYGSLSRSHGRLVIFIKKQIQIQKLISL